MDGGSQTKEREEIGTGTLLGGARVNNRPREQEVGSHLAGRDLDPEARELFDQ
jgi:hypothetical protein